MFNPQIKRQSYTTREILTLSLLISPIACLNQVVRRPPSPALTPDSLTAARMPPK